MRTQVLAAALTGCILLTSGARAQSGMFPGQSSPSPQQQLQPNQGVVGAPAQGPAPSAAPVLEMRSKPLRNLGMTFTIVGAATFVIGLAVFGAGTGLRGDSSCSSSSYYSSSSSYSSSPPSSCRTGKDMTETVAPALMVPGGIFLAVGIPLWIVGAVKVEKDPQDQAKWYKPELALERSGGGLRWAF